MIEISKINLFKLLKENILYIISFTIVFIFLTNKIKENAEFFSNPILEEQYTPFIKIKIVYLNFRLYSSVFAIIVLLILSLIYLQFSGIKNEVTIRSGQTPKYCERISKDKYEKESIETTKKQIVLLLKNPKYNTYLENKKNSNQEEEKVSVIDNLSEETLSMRSYSVEEKSLLFKPQNSLVHSKVF